MVAHWRCRAADGTVRSVASVHRVDAAGVAPIELRAVRPDGRLVRACGDAGAIGACRLDLTGRTDGLPTLVEGGWTDGGFAPGALLADAVTFGRDSEAWDARGVGYAADAPIWASDATGLWIQPGATRLNTVISMNPPVDAAVGFLPTDVTRISPFGSTGEIWRSADPDVTPEYIQKINLPEPVIGDYYTTVFHIFANQNCQVNWRKYGFNWENPDASVRLEIPEGWSQQCVMAAAVSNEVKLLVGVREIAVTQLELAVTDIQISPTTYAPLPLLGPAGTTAAVAPDACAVTPPFAAATLLVDLGAYRGGDGDGCLVHVPDAGTLRIDPATGAVRYDDAAGWSMATEATVTPQGPARIAIASGTDETRLVLDGGTVATHTAPAAMLSASATAAARLGNDGAGNASLAKWRYLTALAEPLDAAQLQAATA